jgi:hypothetical protein
LWYACYKSHIQKTERDNRAQKKVRACLCAEGIATLVRIVESGNRLWCWLWGRGHVDVDPISYGQEPEAAGRQYAVLLAHVQQVCAVTGEVCTAELIPALRGLEGRRVELEFHDNRGRVHCIIGRQRYGVLAVHTAKRNEKDHGEPLTSGDFRLVRVL